MANRKPHLVLNRVNLAGEHPVSWLRVVHAPKAGPVQFSPLIDLKGKTGTPLRIETELQPACDWPGSCPPKYPGPFETAK